MRLLLPCRKTYTYGVQEPSSWHLRSLLSKNKDFALAHKGVLYNNHTLKQTEKLPATKIQTDYYEAVQLIDKKKALTLEQQNKFIEFVKDNKAYKHWLPLFTVMLSTGMRVGEVTGLRWQDVDFENRLININHTLVFYSRGKKEGCHFAVNTPKTKASIRTIPMTDTVAETFEAEKRFKEELEVSCRVVIDGYTDVIFINRFGDTQHYGTVNKAIKRIIRDCNLESLEKIKKGEKPVLLPDFSSHTFRHTFAARMCEANVNIKAIQSILGHSDVRISLNVYTDATEDLKTRELSEYSEYMNKALSQ